jgi:hypothetical protein
VCVYEWFILARIARSLFKWVRLPIWISFLLPRNTFAFRPYVYSASHFAPANNASTVAGTVTLLKTMSGSLAHRWTWLFQVQGVWSTSYIPRGTRFGPLVGEVYAKDEVPKTANRKYFWRVSTLFNLSLTFFQRFEFVVYFFISKKREI